jgi:hypothetical protein
VFLHPVGSADHVVHSYVYVARTIDTLFLCSSGPVVVSIKSAMGHDTLNLCFCIQWDLWDTYCILMHPECKISTHYFSFSGGPGAVSIKSIPGYVMPNLCFASYGIWGSRSAFRCVRGTKHDRTILHTRVGPVQIRRKEHRDKLC